MEAGEILLRRGLLNQRQLDMSRSAQNDGNRLDQVAVDMGFLSEESALKALGAEVGIDFVDLPEAKVNLTLLASFPQKLIHRQNMFPLRRENGSLIVAIVDTGYQHDVARRGGLDGDALPTGKIRVPGRSYRARGGLAVSTITSCPGTSRPRRMRPIPAARRSSSNRAR